MATIKYCDQLNAKPNSLTKFCSIQDAIGNFCIGFIFQGNSEYRAIKSYYFTLQNIRNNKSL